MEDDVGTLDALASFLDEAVAQKHLPDPNVKGGGNQNEADAAISILAIRSRLIELGYLSESQDNRSHEGLDDALKKAIRAYQQDAGLELVDGWVGPITWHTLQQLVSFEEEQDPQSWKNLMGAHEEDPALWPGFRAIVRAMYLRLYVLGFFDWDKKLDTKTDVRLDDIDFRSALNAFLKNAHTIGLTEKRLAPEMSLQVLKALFQQDDIVYALYEHPTFVHDPDNKTFVEAVARIELWLMGFDVHLGRPRKVLKSRRTRGGERHIAQVKRVAALPNVLEDFWKQYPENLRPKSKKRRRIVGSELFARLVVMEAEVLTSDDEMEADVVTLVQSFTPEQKRQLQDKVWDLASSVWDGVKRVARWIKRLVGRVISAGMNLMKNIARFIVKRAGQVFKTAQKAIEILYRGVVYLRESIFPGSDVTQMVLQHDKDFDVKIFVHQGADSLARKKLIEKNRDESFTYGVACRILADLLAILKQIAKGFVAGWLLLLLGLTRLGKRLRDIAADVRLVEQFEFEGSPFTSPV